MLLLTDLSGIQDFLFDVREEGGGQARSLRFRSFRIQLIAECIARRLLWAFRLPDDALISCAAGKVVIDSGQAAGLAPEIVRREAEGIERWLAEQMHGRLRFAVATADGGESSSDLYQRALDALQVRKRRAWTFLATTNGRWRPGELVGPSPPNFQREAEVDERMGRRLLKANRVRIGKTAQGGAPGDADDIVGLSVRFDTSASCGADADAASVPLDRLARHIPRDERDRGIEFVDLADRARGTPALGVLKADADSLGLAIHEQLRVGEGLLPLRRLTRDLENFFGHELDGEMARKGSSWSSLYTIFSGGDDMLLVGPWDTAMAFASHLQKRYEKRFGTGTEYGLTLSAAVAIIKPRYPIRLAANVADRLLDRAKQEAAPGAEEPKDQFAAFGQMWKWRDHERIIDAGKQLADWCDAHVIRRGWMHTLLELTRIRRDKAPLGGSPWIPEQASSRLASQVARNWPHTDDPNPQSREARCWVDRIREDFDDAEDVETRYLPAILRYALLATRPQDQENTS